MQLTTKLLGFNSLCSHVSGHCEVAYEFPAQSPGMDVRQDRFASLNGLSIPQNVMSMCKDGWYQSMSRQYTFLAKSHRKQSND